MTGYGLTNLHFVPQGQTLTSNYYIKELLDEKGNPLIPRPINTLQDPTLPRFSYHFHFFGLVTSTSFTPTHNINKRARVIKLV